MDGPRTLHSVRDDAYNYVWDNSLEPALEIDPDDTVELHVRDASDEQITVESGAEDVVKLDFGHVNPVSGPVFVKGAQPGDVLEVELLAFKPRDWGWTALIPASACWRTSSRTRGSASRGSLPTQGVLPGA